MNRFILLNNDHEEVPPDSGHVMVRESARNLLWTAAEFGRMTHEDAEAFVKTLRIGGRDDWQLAEVEPLFLLADRTRHDPAIDTVAFPKCKSGWYWSTTRWAPSPEDCAWGVYLGSGDSYAGGRDGDGFVRAVCQV